MSEQRNTQPHDPAEGPEQGSGPATPPRPAMPPRGADGASPEQDNPTQSYLRGFGAQDNPTQAFPRPDTQGSGGYATGPQTAYQQQSGHSHAQHGQGTPGIHTYPAGTYAGSSAFSAPAPAPRKQAKRFGAPTLVAGMVIAALIGGGSAVGANYLIDGGAQPVASSSATPGQAVVINNPDNVTAVTAAAAKASPSVVTIEVVGQSQAGSGSGIILDTDGHILTNTHVVTLGGAASSPDITVRTSDGGVHKATIVGTDPLSDLAVIKVDAKDLQPATLGESSKLNVGDTAIAIGAPLGLSGTVTDGIVSTLNRTISVASSAVPKDSAEGQDDGGDQFNFQFPDQQQQQQNAGGGSIYINVIQTDAAINHGNSGGALVDVNGEIIGVNVAIASAASGTSGEDSGSIGVGFAIPIDYAKRIANDLIQNGKASHGLLGVTVQAKPAETGNEASSFSVGAQIHSVSPDSPAEKAGLKAGDVITGVGERTIDDSKSLTAAIREYAEGAKATIEFTRDGASQTAEVTVGASPAG